MNVVISLYQKESNAIHTHHAAHMIVDEHALNNKKRGNILPNNTE
jgi:hypothetical protein